jgi:hypothetical protein
MPYTKTVNNGYHATSVTYDKRLAYKPYASAGVNIEHNEFGDTCYTLRSYCKNILSLFEFHGKNNIYRYLVVGHVNYSRTTITHVNAFLSEYVSSISYHECKEIWEKNDKVMAINLKTGEIIDADKVYEFFENGYNG